MKRKLSLILTVMLTTILLLAACAANGGDDEQATDPPVTNGDEEQAESPDGEEATEPPIEIIFFRLGIGYDPSTDPVVHELERITNTSITFITAPWDQSGARVNTLIAGGTGVDVISLEDYNVDWLGLARNNTFVQLDDYLQTGNWELLQAITYNPSYARFLVDGRAFGVPQPVEPGGGWVMAFRTDWLANVGIDRIPETSEELYEVMWAFRYNDPRGDGSDTMAWTIDTINGLGALLNVYSPPTGWVSDGAGGIVHRYQSDPYKEALRFANRLWNDGLLNQDIFAIADRTTTMSDFATERTGMLFTPGMSDVVTQLWVNNPDATIDVARVLPHNSSFTNGAIADDVGAAWKINVIPSFHTAPVERILDLLEFLNTFEGRVLMCFGIEGMHYQYLQRDEENRNWIAMGTDRSHQNDQWAGDATHPLSWGLGNTIIGFADFLAYPTALEAIENYWLFTSDLEMEENPHFYDQRRFPTYVLAENLLRGIPLETWSTYGGRLDGIAEEFQVMLISGSPTEADFERNWESFMQMLDQSGMITVTEEANELYRSLN